MTWLGEPEKGVEWLQAAMRLDPFGVRERAHLLGRTLFAAQRYAEAADAYRQSAHQNRAERHADVAATLAQAGRVAEMATEVAETLKIKPEFSVRPMSKASVISATKIASTTAWRCSRRGCRRRPMSQIGTVVSAGRTGGCREGVRTSELGY